MKTKSSSCNGDEEKHELVLQVFKVTEGWILWWGAKWGCVGLELPNGKPPKNG